MMGANIDGSALRGVRADMMSPNSPALGSMGENLGDDDFGHEGQERNAQFNNALLGELTNQKSKYGKAIKQLERQSEQLRQEKSQLAQVMET